MSIIIKSINEILQSKNLLNYDINNKLVNFEKEFNHYKNKVLEAESKNETEEHFKSIFKDFIRDTYEYNINTSLRIDGVIYNSNNEVNTIIEFKKPDNTVEMISEVNFNKKAMHECILYYYKENTFVNNLIITNCKVIYLFSAKEFRDKILNNKNIESILVHHKNKDIQTLLKTSDVYDALEIVLKDESINIEACKIDLFDEGINKEDLYRIFDEHFIFNKKLENDANTICDIFYKELIHIMGLKEDKDNKLVKSEIKNTLLDLTINMVGKDIAKNEQFEYALSLNILWINRILFLKILESSLRVFRDEKDFDILNPKNIDDYNSLYILFFSVLPIIRKDRDSSITQYNKIPYLNSSLFEEAIKEKTHSITKLNSKSEIEIFSGSVLYKDKTFKKKKLTLLNYLLEFLNCYKFNSDEENTNNNTVIKSSVLGLVFERLNGYSEGAHFTPSIITMYMSKTVIENLIVTKFNKAFSDTSFSNYEEIKKYAENNFHKEDKRSIAEFEIDDIKIIDPSCGSGHFLVSCLNEIIRIKSELKLSCNDVNIQVSNDEIIIKYINGEDFIYKISDDHINEKKQSIQKNIFDMKKHIIENQLYGVDINTNSVNICRLRLWIELLKHSYYTDNDYLDLEVLPNLEFKIVAGNSLIKPEYGGLFFTDNDKAELRKNMHAYYTASYDEKRAIKKVVESLVATLKDDPNNTQIKNYEPFDVLAKNDFFDSELMFGIDSFDIVIMNPPYFGLTGGHKYLNYIHKGESKTIDIYQLFLENAFKLINDEGFVNAVVSNKWMRAGYGERSRKWLYKNTKVIELIDLGANWFDSATVDTNIILYKKEIKINETLDNIDKIEAFKISKCDCIEEAKSELETKMYIEAKATAGSWIILNETEAGILEKMNAVGKPLKDWDISINRGVITGFNEAFIIDTETKNRLIAEDEKSAEIIKPMLRGRDIKRYSYEFADKWIIIAKYESHLYLESQYPAIYKHLLQYEEQLKNRGQCKYSRGGKGEGQHHWLELDNNPKDDYLEKFEKPKICWIEICDNNQFHLDISKMYNEATSFIMNSDTINLYYLLGLLNSKSIKWCLHKISAATGMGTFRWKKVWVEQIPIPVPSQKDEREIVALVDTILDKKAHGLDTVKEEAKIDEIVYSLYGLSEGEISVVRGENS